MIVASLVGVLLGLVVLVLAVTVLVRGTREAALPPSRSI